MLRDEAFCWFESDIFGRSTEDRFIPEISVYLSKEKVETFPWWKLSNIINLPPGDKLITWVHAAISATQLVSAAGRWSIYVSHNQVTLGEWKYILLSLCINYTPPINKCSNG